MRVVQASCFPDPRGREPEALLEAWPSLSGVAAATARAGADVTVVQSASRDRVLEFDGVRFEFVAERVPSGLRRRLGPWTWPAPRRLAGAVARNRPDVLHVHGLGFVRQALVLVQPIADAKLLVQDHADHPPQRWKRPWHRQGFRRMDGALFTDPEQARPFRAAGLLGTPTRVYAVPESSSTFSPGDRDAARAATGLHGDPCLLWLGRLDGNKDPITILDALAITVWTLPDARLWCCFRAAPLYDDVRARIETDPRLRGRVHLLGERPHSDVERLLRAADFLVQGSRHEGSGYAVLEAMACGTPPLVTRIPAFHSLTAGGRYGALSPPGDAGAMAEAWTAWARRDRQTTRAEVRAHFERELSFSAIGEKLNAVYRELAR